MNCNEEFVIKAVGRITLELNLELEEQSKISSILHECLCGYTPLTKETSLMASDIEEKIILYLQVKKLENYSKATLKNYYYILREFNDFMKKPVASINKNDLRLFLSSSTKDNKPSTFNNKLSILKAFFQWLSDEDIIKKNPARLLKQNKLPKRLRKSLTMEELEKLRLACSNVRERAIIEFLVSTGCRVSEIINTNISDINFDTNTLRVIGKGNKERTVFINDKTKVYIKNYLITRKDNNPALFVTKRYPNKRLSIRGFEFIIKNIGARANLGKVIFPHLFRHTFATLGLQNGADLGTIQHILGHTTPSTTQTYAENSIENINHEYKQHLIH